MSEYSIDSRLHFTVLTVALAWFAACGSDGADSPPSIADDGGASGADGAGPSPNESDGAVAADADQGDASVANDSGTDPDTNVGADADADAAKSTVGSTYYYDEQGYLLGEYDLKGNPRQELIYLDDRVVAVVRDGKVHTVQTDQIGAPRAVLDQGAPVWTWDPEPFGATAPDEDPDNDGLSFTFHERFPGQRLDPVTGLFQNFHRNYAPDWARYLEADPIGLNGGPNLFAYVGGNPVMLWDFLGLQAVQKCSNPVEHMMLWAATFGQGRHYWLNSGSVHGGMSGDLVGDHRFEYQKTTICVEVKDVDPDCVKQRIQAGMPTGGWRPWNTCKDFVNDVIEKCRVRKSVPTLGGPKVTVGIPPGGNQ